MLRDASHIAVHHFLADELRVCFFLSRRFISPIAGFVLLQYLLESLSGKPIHELMAPWLAQLGLRRDIVLLDRHGVPASLLLAPGVVSIPMEGEVSDVDDGQLNDVPLKIGVGFSADNAPYVPLQFPTLAAGMLGTTRGVARFCAHLVRAYRNLDGSGPISHDTAVQMLHRRPPTGCQEFMGCDSGLGIFIAEVSDFDDDVL